MHACGLAQGNPGLARRASSLVIVLRAVLVLLLRGIPILLLRGALFLLLRAGFGPRDAVAASIFEEIKTLVLTAWLGAGCEWNALPLEPGIGGAQRPVREQRVGCFAEIAGVLPIVRCVPRFDRVAGPVHLGVRCRAEIRAHRVTAKIDVEFHAQPDLRKENRLERPAVRLIHAPAPAEPASRAPRSSYPASVLRQSSRGPLWGGFRPPAPEYDSRMASDCQISCFPAVRPDRPSQLRRAPFILGFVLRCGGQAPLRGRAPA